KLLSFAFHHAESAEPAQKDPISRTTDARREGLPPPPWTNLSCCILSPGAFAIVSMCALSLSKPVSSAGVSLAMLIICDSRKIGLSAAKSVVSSQSRCAADTIASCIVTATNQGGGRSWALIRAVQREHCGPS